MYSSKGLNYNYMEFVGYETCDKLIWTSGKGIRITNKSTKKEFLKVTPTRYLFHQHWVFVVS